MDPPSLLQHRQNKPAAGPDSEPRAGSLENHGGVVVVLVTQGDAKETLTHQGKEIMFNLAGIPRITKTWGRLFGDPVALIQLSQEKTVGVRSYPAAIKIGDDFFGEKALKDELFMADCFHRVSSLRSCLFSDNSILADTLSFFENFSWIILDS